jgi:hypothetical protein
MRGGGGRPEGSWLIREGHRFASRRRGRAFECGEAGNWDLAKKLKPLITEPTVSVNIKYGPQKEVQDFARFLMFSNHSVPLSIEEGTGGTS